MRRALGVALLLLGGCDGLGRPIVDERPIFDGGEDDRCEVTPACRPPRAVDPSALAVPPDRLAPPVFLDCDGDTLPDDRDPCPGVPELEGDCAEAAANCARLEAGATDLRGADLRGCRVAGPIAVAGALSLSRSDLRCASLTLVAAEHTSGSWSLDESRVEQASLSIAAERSLVVEASRATLRGSFVRLAGGARLRAHEAVLEDARLLLEPGSASGSDPAPAVELAASDVSATTLFETPGAWPGRVRIDRSNVRDTTIVVRALELVGSRLVTTGIRAAQLLGVDLELVTAQLDVDYAAFAGATLGDVVFARCLDLSFAASRLEDVDVPACAPERLRFRDTEVLGAALAGGVLLEESELRSSVVGSGPSSVLRAEESELDAVTICDLGAAAFFGGELRCVKCEDDAFMNGASVCLAATNLYERGCPAIELAPECP